MPSGFYELLNVSPDADAQMIRSAYTDQVAQLTRRLRAAESRQADLAPMESRRAALAEAWAVLSDPVRRRRYDRYRELARQSLPSDPDELWNAASRSLVEPAAAAALEVVRTLTDLRVGDAVGIAEIALDPEPAEAHVQVVAAAPPRPAPTPPLQPPIDRGVSGEDLARLLDVYGPTGAYLRAVRDARRLSLEDLAASTRISHRFLDAMERDAFAELPGATFVRGYLKMVLRSLEVLQDGEDAEEYVEDWMSRFHRARG